MMGVATSRFITTALLNFQGFTFLKALLPATNVHTSPQRKMSFSLEDALGGAGDGNNTSLNQQAQVAPDSLPLPYEFELSSGTPPNFRLLIAGEVKQNPNKFTIDFMKGEDIALHINPRFKGESHQVIVCNTKINGEWGPEERNAPCFPFVAGKRFEIYVLCEQHQFKMAVNGNHMIEYRHRIKDLNEITKVRLHGDIKLFYLQPFQ
ncbi:galectin-3-like [Latimeria chalumnae]